MFGQVRGEFNLRHSISGRGFVESWIIREIANRINAADALDVFGIPPPSCKASARHGLVAAGTLWATA